MKITALYTLEFTTTSETNKIHDVAMSVITLTASQMGLEFTASNHPMAEGQTSRISSFQVESQREELCVDFWNTISVSLPAIGVEVRSP